MDKPEYMWNSAFYYHAREKEKFLSIIQSSICYNPINLTGGRVERHEESIHH